MSTTSDYFIELASLDPKIRISAAQSIITILKKAESEIENGEHSEVMIYSLNRLVKSLASSHDCARDGNLLCLILLLQTFQTVEEGSVIEIATSNFTTTGNTREGLRNVLFGKLCACLALIKSQRICKNETIEYIMRTLLFLANKKSYLSEIVTEALILLIKTAKDNVKDILIASINERMKTVTPETILPLDVSLICLQKSLGINITLPNCFENGFFDEKAIKAIKLAFKLACDVNGSSRVPLFHHLIQYSKENKQLNELTQKILVPMCKGDHCYYVILMGLADCFKDLNETEIPQVLQPTLVRSLIAVSLAKKHALKKVVANFLKVISQNEHYHYVILSCLIGEGGSIYLDKISGTKTLSKLSQHLSSSELDRYIQSIMELLSQKNNLPWLLELITSIASSPNTSKETHAKVLTLLYALAHKLPHEYIKTPLKNKGATQRYLQFALNTQTKEYVNEVLSNFEIIYNFIKTQEDNKISKDFEKILKKCNKKPYYQILLYYLVFEIDDSQDAQDILNDALKAIEALLKDENDVQGKEVIIDILIGLLGRSESQVRALVNMVWKEVVINIGDRLKNVFEVLMNSDENLMIEEDEEEGKKEGEEEIEEKEIEEEDNEEKEIDVLGLLENENAQEEILIHKKMKQLDKKKKEQKGIQQLEFLRRLCELIEVYCKNECNKKEFVETIPIIIEGTGHFFNKTRFAPIYLRLMSVCEGISKHGPIIKDVNDVFMKEQFDKFKELLTKKKTSQAAQKVLGYFIKYVEKGFVLLGQSVKEYFISQLEREFSKKRSLPFKVIEGNIKRSELLQGTDVIKTCITGAMGTSNMYLRIQTLDLAYFLLKKVGNKTDYKEIAEMVNNNVEEWMKVIIEHCEQKYAFKISLVMNCLINGIVKSGIKFDSKYEEISKYITDNLEEIPSKYGNLKKYLNEIKESINKNKQ